jgi:hypothetical protein
MNRWRVGEDRGSEEKDRCPLTITFEAIKAQDVCTADGSTISALGRGDIKVNLLLSNTYTTITLKNTLYTPKMALTLISAHQITAARFTVQFENDACKILSPAPKQKLIALIAQVNGLYAIPTQTEESTHVAKLTINGLHQALGHVAQGAVQYAVKQGLIEGVELNSASTPEFCDACMKAKATCQPFPEEMTNCARTHGELVHTDLWGPTQTESVAGHLYYISFTNDFSREMKVCFLKLKSEALSALKDYETEMRQQTPGAKIKKLRSDRGGEYLSTEFDRYLKDQGIKRQLTVHHLPQQNGVAERLNCTLVEHA